MSKSFALARFNVAKFAVIAGALLGGEPPAAANTPIDRKVCGREIRSLCPWRPWRPTPNDITSCVEKKRERLSANCQVFWDTAKQCQIEIRKVCGGLNPFTLRGCLKERQAEFSATCRASFDLQEKPDGSSNDEAQP